MRNCPQLGGGMSEKYSKGARAVDCLPLHKNKGFPEKAFALTLLDVLTPSVEG